MVFSNTSLGNVAGLIGQLILEILMTDGPGPANEVHDGLSRCHRVTRSVMASEVHVLFLALAMVV